MRRFEEEGGDFLDFIVMGDNTWTHSLYPRDETTI